MLKIILGFLFLILPLTSALFPKKDYRKKHHLILFISLCGLTNIIDGLNCFLDISFLEYINVVITLVTFIVSIFLYNDSTCYRTPQEYNALESKIKEANEAMERIREINHDLANKCQTLTNTIEIQGYINKNQLKLDELKAIVNNFRKEYNK